MVDIGEEVVAERITGEGVSLFAGTRIYGEKTSIAKGVKLGLEAPVTVVNCQLGPHVELKGGFYTTSTFLANASMGSGAQLREGCLIGRRSQRRPYGRDETDHPVSLRHSRQPDQLLRLPYGRGDEPQEPQRGRQLLHPFQLYPQSG